MTLRLCFVWGLGALEDDDWEDFIGSWLGGGLRTWSRGRRGVKSVLLIEMSVEVVLVLTGRYLLLWRWKWRVEQGSMFGSLSLVYVLWLWMHTKMVYVVFFFQLREKKCLVYIWVKWFLVLLCILGMLWRKMGNLPHNWHSLGLDGCSRSCCIVLQVVGEVHCI